jgi:glycyl-tRNA synthetase beta chain
VAEHGEFLLEVGCEELPAAWLPELTQELGTRFGEAARREQLEPRALETHSTPRRLVLRVELPLRQADREEQVWGPALGVARDAQGQWTKAAEGFARKAGVALEALAQAPKDPAKPAEINLLFVKHTPGRATREVLPSLLATTLRALSFPKRMSWDAWLDDGKGVFPFGRPIRWLVALFDGQVVPFTIYAAVQGAQGPALVTSADLTYGHRFLPRGQAGAPLRVSSHADLVAKLRAHAVLLRADERAAAIEQQLEALGVQGAIRDDHGLRDEWTQLVEFPTVLVGSVPAEFQSLPVEVLETVLVHHQKYIPLLSPEGRVARFAALTNIDAQAGAEIVRGMERVCVARFRDAAFFYAEDRKRPLAARVDDLAGVTFHQKLGSYRDKAERLTLLVRRAAEAGWLSPTEQAAAGTAARLAKADLTTAMVREFTELQGVMGGVYLEGEGAQPAVARAVRWHYHPIALRAHEPPSREAIGNPAVFGAVALADKLDTLAGYFLVGLEPRGSSDPFGLRRAAQGAVRVLLDFTGDGQRPRLRQAVRLAIEGYPDALLAAALASEARPRGAKGEAAPPSAPPKLDDVRARATAALEAFLSARLESVLETRGPCARDEIAAALAAPRVDALDDPYDAERRARALHDVRHEAHEDLAALAAAFKRVNNILADQAPGAALDPALFDKPSEAALHAALEHASAAQAGHDYLARLRALARLREPIDRFFAREQEGGVMVMADDPAVRANRLGLLSRARDLFHDIADISKLGGTQ